MLTAPRELIGNDDNKFSASINIEKKERKNGLNIMGSEIIVIITLSDVVTTQFRSLQIKNDSGPGHYYQWVQLPAT